MKYTMEEKILMYNMYSQGNSLRQVSDLFSIRYPDRPIPCKWTISSIVKQFNENGCIHDGHRKNRRQPYKIDDNKKIDILASIENNARASTRELAAEYDVSQTSVWKVLKAENFKSYKFQNHQELQPADPERRQNFCEFMFNRFNEDMEFLNKIVFTDESTFTLHCEANSQNCRYWARENQHLYFPTRTQFPQKINVWAGMVGNNILGPFFLEDNLTAELYLQLLQERIVPAVNNLGIENVWYQHDGAPCHSARIVSEYLNNTFPGRWIGRTGPIRWPARSPDLSPLDYFYWGYLKTNVYHFGPIQNIDLLKERIMLISQQITRDKIQNAIDSFYHRMGYCMIQNGAIFEHLL